MNALEERMLALLADRMRGRPEIVADLESVANQIKASPQTPEDWMRLAEKLKPSAEEAEQHGGAA